MASMPWGTPYSLLYREAAAKRGAFFAPSKLKDREIGCFSSSQGRQDTP